MVLTGSQEVGKDASWVWRDGENVNSAGERICHFGGGGRGTTDSKKGIQTKYTECRPG